VEALIELDKIERAAIIYRTAYHLREIVWSSGDRTEKIRFCSIEVTKTLPLLTYYLLTYLKLMEAIPLCDKIEEYEVCSKSIRTEHSTWSR